MVLFCCASHLSSASFLPSASNGAYPTTTDTGKERTRPDLTRAAITWSWCPLAGDRKAFSNEALWGVFGES